MIDPGNSSCGSHGFIGNGVFPLNRVGMRADALWSVGLQYHVLTNRVRHLTLVLGLLASAPRGLAAQAATEPEGWGLTFTPYVWMSGLEGTIGVGTNITTSAPATGTWVWTSACRRRESRPTGTGSTAPWAPTSAISPGKSGGSWPRPTSAPAGRILRDSSTAGPATTSGAVAHSLPRTASWTWTTTKTAFSTTCGLGVLPSE